MGYFEEVGRGPEKDDVFAMQVASGFLYPDSRFTFYLPLSEKEEVIREPLSMIFSILFGLFKKERGISKTDNYMANISWRKHEPHAHQIEYEFNRKDLTADFLFQVTPDLNADEGTRFITSYLNYILNYKDNYFKDIDFTYINKIVGEDLREWNKVTDEYVLWAKEIAEVMLEKIDEGHFAYKEHIWHGDVWD